MRITKSIPNFLTLLNLLSGSIAIIFAFSGELTFAAWFIILAAVLDFFDGFVARLLHAGSEIGAQLDSLADVVSFGLAPAVIMYHLLLQSANLPDWNIGTTSVWPFSALLLVIAGAYRLARFNTDPGQEKVFKGLPIPAGGLFVASLPLILHQYSDNQAVLQFLTNFYLLLAVSVFLSFIMVSTIPMPALKFKTYSLKNNLVSYILLFCIPVLFILFKFAAIPLIIVLYLLFSLVTLLIQRKTN